jgi:hypothetical protein
MPTIVKPIPVCAVLLLALTACSKLGGGGQDEMTWARDALDRNSHLEVVASDPQAKTFTVRVKDSGKLVVVPLDQVMAGPQGVFEASSKPAGADAAPTSETLADTPSQVPGAAERVSTPPSPTSGPSAGSSALASAGEPAQPNGDSSGSRQAAASDAAEANDSAAAEPSTAQIQGPHAESATNAKAGSVLASGPGYSIKASGPKGTVQRVSQVTAARGTPLERLHDPIICQGSRLLHIDNRNLEFDGDAVSAEDGCEIHITNTHISAKGIGVLARAANVHIENSEIEGDSGAIDASDGAQVYAESSRFKGLTRRMESSAFHDLGGNVWN